MSIIILALSSLVCAGHSRRVQTKSENNVIAHSGVHEWELQNVAQYRAGEINDAELGMANLVNTINDPAVLSEVAHMLHDPASLAELTQTMDNVAFQQQAKQVVTTMKASGTMPDFLKVEYYKGAKKQAHSSLLQALDPAAAFSPSNSAVGSAAHASHPKVAARPAVRMETMADLESKAKELNPLVGYWDPLGLSKSEFWGTSNEATIGFLRHSEIKHGRIAMAGFVGYCLHENGVHWPWLSDYSPYQGLSAPAIWDATPQSTRISIILTVGFFDFWSENKYVLEADGATHYMKGGKPGYFPKIKPAEYLDAVKPLQFKLWDPLNFVGKLSEEEKSKKLNAEINNGRLAMLGLMSFVSEAKVPGAVPALSGKLKPYTGEVMAPLTASDTNLPFVKAMLGVSPVESAKAFSVFDL